MKVFIRAVLVGLILLAIGGAWKAYPLIEVGAGYMAKRLCSEHFVAGRKDTIAILDDLVSVDRNFRHISSEIDEQSRTVSAWVGPGIGESVAVYRPHLGCTLAAGVTPDDLQELSPQSSDAITTSFTTGIALPSARRLIPELEQVLDRAFAEPFEGSQRNTRSIVILQDGKIVAERYAEGVTAETAQIGWSMSKSITNTIVGLLVKDGLLDVDAPAPVSEWADPSDVRHAITLENLLQMSSGLDFEEVYQPGSDATRMLFTEYSAGNYAARAGLAHPPGTHWYYSSGTSNILSRITFEKSGDSMDSMYEYMNQRLFGPLGLESMILEPDASGVPVGSSFTYATARDWARLGQFWLNEYHNPNLLPRGWMQWSVQPAPAAPRGEYGAQFWLNAGRDGEGHYWPDLPHNLFFANGYNGQSVVVFPDEDIVVVRLGLSTDDSWSLGELLRGTLEALDS